MKIIKGMSNSEVNSLLEKNGWTIRLNDLLYRGNNEAHDWTCECGGTIEKRSFSTIKRRNSILCSKCVYRKKEEEYRTMVEAVPDYKYIRSYRSGDITENGIVVKNSPHIRIEHTLCGRSYDIVVSGFKKGNRCEVCSKYNENKLAKGMMKDEVNEILIKNRLTIKLYDSIYCGNNENHNWICECGRIIEKRTFAKIRDRNSVLCEMCIYEKKEEEYKKMVEDVSNYKYVRSYRCGDTTENGILVKDSPYIRIQHIICGRTYDTTVVGFKQGKQRCTCAPYDKSIYNLYPQISEMIYADANGNTLKDSDKKHIYSNSSKKFYFKCSRCGMISNECKVLSTVSNNGYSCEFCSDGISIPEKFHIYLLKSLNVEFNYQKSFKWSKRKVYDFYIPKYNLIIETHGIQHYEESARGRSLKEEQKNDMLKRKLAKNNVSKYIEVDCRESSLEWIKYNCIKELSSIFDLSLVNWDNIWKFCQNSYVVEAWNLKNRDYTINEIADKLKVTATTARKYIKSGQIIDECSYDNEGRRRKTICLNTGEIFNSLFEAGSSIGLTQKEMYRCCNSKSKQLGTELDGTPLKWMYYDEYLKTSDDVIEKLKRKRHYSNREVICVTTEEKFKNSVEAAKVYNIHDRNIRACCYGDRNYCGKLNDGTRLEWMFLEEYNTSKRRETST